MRGVGVFVENIKNYRDHQSVLHGRVSFTEDAQWWSLVYSEKINL